MELGHVLGERNVIATVLLKNIGFLLSVKWILHPKYFTGYWNNVTNTKSLLEFLKWYIYAYCNFQGLLFITRCSFVIRKRHQRIRRPSCSQPIEFYSGRSSTRKQDTATLAALSEALCKQNQTVRLINQTIWQSCFWADDGTVGKNVKESTKVHKSNKSQQIMAIIIQLTLH